MSHTNSGMFMAYPVLFFVTPSQLCYMYRHGKSVRVVFFVGGLFWFFFNWMFLTNKAVTPEKYRTVCGLSISEPQD